MSVYYVDSSALVKLVVAEPETDALRTWLAESEAAFVAGDLVRTEVLRAVRRTAPDRAVQARAVLDSIELISIATATFEAAALLDPTIIRSLDAIHLAVALELGDDLLGMVVYDDRLAVAAQTHGISVRAPGRE